MSNDNELQTISTQLRSRTRALLDGSSLPPDERDSILRDLLQEVGVYERELETQNQELEKTRDQLRATLERYGDLFEQAPAAHVTLRADGSIMAANAAAVRLFGVERNALIEHQFGELIREPFEGTDRNGRRRVVHIAAEPRLKVLLDARFVGTGDVTHHVTLIPLDATGNGEEITTEAVLTRRTAELDAANRSLRDEVRARDAVERRIRNSRTRLRALAERLSRVEEDQRRKLATELHDLIGQTLISANMKLALLERDIQSESHKGQVQEIRSSVREMVETARSIIAELRPPVLDEQDFETAVVWLCHIMAERYGQTIETDIRCLAPIADLGMKEFLFRAIRELLKNAAHHSGSDAVHLTVAVTRTSVNVQVRDEGAGFDISALDEGFGLFEIRERIEAFGGQFTLESRTGAGTAVSICIPMGNRTT